MTRMWYRVESGRRHNAMGNPTSYQLVPDHSDLSILDPDEPQQQRASFSGAALWATRYNPQRDVRRRHLPEPEPQC